MNAPGSAGVEVDEVIESKVEFTTPDGYRLGAVMFTRADLCAPADAAVFNAGGGLSSLRYRHFLRFLASKRIPVLAYDYRGVGMSRPTRWRGFDAGIEDWCEFDQASAIETLRSRFPEAHLASVSHSIGCMVAAGAPNAPTLKQMVFIAPHTAYWGDYLQPWRWPMALTWHVLMPAAARAFGHFPAGHLGLGDDLPRRVALQWASRRTPDYRPGSAGGDAAREAVILDRLARLSVPTLVISIADDAFAPEVAVRRFLMGLPSTPMVRRLIRVQEGRKTIGHIGFFRRSCSHQWPMVSSFIKTAVTDSSDPPATP